MPGIDGLRTALEALPLRIDEVQVRSGHVSLDSYPDGPRPTSTAILGGGGLQGFGEHVGWTDEEHESFRERAARAAVGNSRLGRWCEGLRTLPPYDRAALEAAAVDLALRQRGTTLLHFAGTAPVPVRFVVSFARTADPIAHADALANDDPELKIDVDPAWPDDVWHRLAILGRVAVLDFKGSGTIEDHEHAARLVAEAWIEDPGPSAGHSPALLCRLSADADVTSVRGLEALIPRPAAVNVKAPRMGGVLEAIGCLEKADHLELESYIGGMFEVGIGRRQALVLATLACPDGPNDIAPLDITRGYPPRLLAQDDWPGFAGDPPR